ncbi:MAG: NAD(+) synthase [Ruminococcus sp.]|nr:NAD(+) synthase [Ruminococcus sp.]
MFDFLTLALAVIKTQVGNTEHNTQQIISKIDSAKASEADIIVFPELALTGYTCGDLFNQKALLDSTLDGLKLILKKSVETDKIIIVGAPLRLNGQLFNCAVVIFGGQVKGIVPKTFIPTTGEFYEKRWFCSAEDLAFNAVTEKQMGISDSEAVVSVGTDLVFSFGDDVTFGIEICEDLWTPLPPATFLALGGAKLLINLSASNETIGKRQYRRELVSQQSARNLAAYAYVSSGKSESTTDLIFSGHSIVCENGVTVAENENYLDDDYILYADIDLGKINHDRMKNKAFKDCAALHAKAHPCRYIKIDGDCFGKSLAQNTSVNRLPFVPSVKKDRYDRCIAIFEMQVAGLCKRLEVTGCKPVIGVSGGLDSTLALLVCARAMRKLGRPLTDVIGITMPCFGTSSRTYNNSLELMKTLGVTSKEINIKKACIQHFDDIGQSETEFNLTYENSQARERTQVLMDYAGKIGGLVVGTGDLSELALGWCTYNADHMSMYGVNASIPKTLVRWMVDSVIDFDIFPESSAVLRDVLDTPISPELLPPDAEGKIQQQTEELVGPYALHDFFLYYVLRFGFEPEKIFFLAKKAFNGSFDNETILKWLKSFYRRFFSQQFKRSCLPDGVKVGSVCLSPRGDWRMPSDACAAIWLNKVENLA